MKKIRVLIADDHEMVLRGLADGIGPHPDFELAGEVSTGPDAVAAYKEQKPDVVLLDFRMPGANGDQVTEEIVAFDPEAKIIMLTSYEWEEDIWRAVIAGALGYIPKSCHMDEIYQCIVEVAAGKRYFPPNIMQKIEAREKRETLTAREQQVLSLLAGGFSNKEIMTHLSLSTGTVRTHVSSILAKLNANDRTHAVVKAVRRGMVHLDL